MSYSIQSKTLSPNKVFILQKSEIEKRLDPFYYVPELVALEKKAEAKNPKRLRDYVISIASGATPKTTESDLYYTNKENGKPFLRVQNLSPTGVLEFDDCKYINEETHNGMLKRSQVSAGDLLVKITGVGRMAVASVAPENFEGNINQHICVIRTKSKELSETLAAFLNSDIGEKLASRRSTGGTRPALDYPALLSIPIIEDKRILEITQKVVEQKKQKEAEAEKLLASIDDYLLGELGISLPKNDEDLQPKVVLGAKLDNGNVLVKKGRLFLTTLRRITQQRFDPTFHRLNYEKFLSSILSAPFKPQKLKDIILYLDYGLMPTQDYAFTESEGIPMIRVTNIMKDGYINMDKTEYIKFDTPKLYDKLVRENDILMVQCGNTTGKCAMVTKEFEGYTFGSFSFGIRSNPEIITQKFLFHILNSQIVQEQLNRSITITSVRPNTSKPEVENFLIPIPSLEKQQQISDHITATREQAQKLKEEVIVNLEDAKVEIERIILGN